MKKDEKYLTDFIRNIINDEYSDASNNLSDIVNEIVKNKMQSFMDLEQKKF